MTTPRSRSAIGVLVAAAAALAAATCGPVAAQGSEVDLPAVVSADAVDWTPHLVAVSGKRKPVALSVAQAGDRMVVGGRFTAVEDSTRQHVVPRSNLVSFSSTTGAVDPLFAPQVDGEVWAVAATATAVYLGGSFTTVDGISRPALAKLDLATGELDTRFRPALNRGRVTDLEMKDGRLFAAGSFPKRLVALDPVTGARSSYLSTAVTGRLPFSTAGQVFKFDVSPDGRHLAAVGNFTAVDGAYRPRVFVLDLGQDSATLSPWHYAPLARSCTSKRTKAIAYVQDVDFAPDSSWFALASFGHMYQPGDRGLMLCDSVSRFDTAVTSPTAPRWINYTGGDSLKSVAVTSSAVYVQGHSRWLDNPKGKDSAGPGSVERLGGGAVDPVTGKALSWNPVMPQQSGGYQVLPTDEGIWFVTDGSRFGGEYHRGIRFAPLP